MKFLDFFKKFKKVVEEKIEKIPEVGEIYVFKDREENPFRKKVFYVKPIAVSGKYVQYIYVNENGNNINCFPIEWDNSIKSFNICYVKKEK